MCYVEGDDACNMPNMTTPKPFSLDNDPEFKKLVAAANKEAEHTAPVVLFGQTYTLHSGSNAFNMLGLEMGDPAALRNTITNLAIEEDRERLAENLAAIPNLTLDMLVAIVKGFTEAVADRPTKSPSGSRSGSAKPATRRTSVGK